MALAICVQVFQALAICLADNSHECANCMLIILLNVLLFSFFFFFFYQNKYGNLGYSNFLKISKTFSNKMVYTYSADADQAVSLLLLH